MSDRALLDQIELRDLVMRYCRGIDRRDFALVRACYHDDAIDDHGNLFKGGPDAYVAWLAPAMAGLECTIHAISNSLFVVNGDVAEGEHYAYAYHRTYAPERQEIIIHGRYLDRYERRAGAWKFAHRQLVFDAGTVRPVDEAGFAAAGGDAAHGTPGRDDPSHALEMLASLGTHDNTPE